MSLQLSGGMFAFPCRVRLAEIIWLGFRGAQLYVDTYHIDSAVARYLAAVANCSICSWILLIE